VEHRLSPGQRSRITRNERFERLRRAVVPEPLRPAWAKAHRARRDAPLGQLDIPVPGADVAGLVPVQGWALGYLDHQIERVDVRIDGVTHGRSEWGFPRADVGELYPGDGRCFCGFGYLLDSRTLSNGPHTIEVVAFDNAAHSAVLGTRSITVVNQAASSPTRIALTPVG
jgi:hypothetical protein